MLMWHIEDNIEKKKCKTGQHEKMAIFNEINPESYRSIYGSLFSEFGEEITTKIHKVYAGRQVSFPKKLYTENYISYYVKEYKEEKTPTTLADELECSERIVRRHIKESLKTDSKESGSIISKYRPVYEELYKEFGEKVMKEIYVLYRGHQISFPKKLYTENYIIHYVKEHMWDMTSSELAKELGYTERRISQLIKSIMDRQDRD